MQEHREGMASLLAQYLDWLRTHNYSDLTVLARDKSLKRFLAWAHERGIASPCEVTRPILERYQRYLHLYRQRNGEPLSVRSQVAHLAPLRAWFKWLARERYVAANPASDLIMPRREFRLPGHVLSPNEVERILAVPDINEPLGLRDRAMLETFYSTGVRRLELIRLTVQDIDHERGLVMVRQGKGKKDRICPVGERALAWIERYVNEVRPALQRCDQAEYTLFLSELGGPLRPNWLSQKVSEYIQLADVKKRGACHLFRHAMATAMLENGADLRFVQAMLGHVHLHTTQIYTHVAVAKLKKIHDATHPAKMKRSPKDDNSSDTDS
ncbi:MAG TPA: site-specific tyrosine recombinase XerC [Gemmataceae bacterium]|nr:site-specific tyrosine recombinase XerC [Gemmataceae bacterium]